VVRRVGRRAWRGHFSSPSLIPVDEIRDGMPPLVAAVREFGLPGSGSTDLLAI
jgi:hypothetical protein